MDDKQWEITDASGNKRRVTLAQFRAELDERKQLAQNVLDAFRRNDVEGCGLAQAAMRARFPNG